MISSPDSSRILNATEEMMEKKHLFVAVGTVSDPYLIMRSTVEEIDEALASLPDVPFTVYDNFGCLRRSPGDLEYSEDRAATDEERRRHWAHLASILACQASILAAKAAAEHDIVTSHCTSFWCWFFPEDAR